MQRDAKIYVAGHRGLVGRALIDALQKKGHQNLITRTRADLDLMDQAAVSAFFAQEKPEYVFLAAAKVGGIAANSHYPADFIFQNLMIQNNVMHQCYVQGVKKLLFFGSSCAYPKNAPQPMAENSLLQGDIEATSEPYAIAKIAGLKLCESYNRQHGTHFIAAIPATLYGPHDNFDLENAHVVSGLMRRMHLGRCLMAGDWQTIAEDLDCDAQEAVLLHALHKVGVEKDCVRIWGSGKPRRDFMSVDDLADASLFLMGHEGLCVDARNAHINIGTGTDYSIKALAALMAKTVGFDGTLAFDTTRPDGALRKCQSSAKINALGWQPRVDLADGLAATYRWYCQKR